MVTFKENGDNINVVKNGKSVGSISHDPEGWSVYIPLLGGNAFATDTFKDLNILKHVVSNFLSK